MKKFMKKHLEFIVVFVFFSCLSAIVMYYTISECKSHQERVCKGCDTKQERVCKDCE